MVLKGSSGAFARPAPSRKRQAKRAKSLKKIDYAGFDANDTEEEPGALAQGMTRLLKRKGKPRGKKKKGKPKRPKGKDGKGTPEPEEADGEPVETPEEIAAREAEENLKKEQADEKGTGLPLPRAVSSSAELFSRWQPTL